MRGFRPFVFAFASVLAGLLALFCANKASAGAWPQSKGTIFVASAVELGFDPVLASLGAPYPVKGWSSFYMDYGVTDRLTLTFDYGQELGGVTLLGLEPARQAYLLLRWDLAPTAVLRRSISGGIGWTSMGMRSQLGLHLGRGFDSRFGSGWLNLDLALRNGGTHPELGMDLVVGLNQSDRLKLLLGVQVKAMDGAEPVLRLAPGLVWQLNRLELELGVSAAAKAPDERRIKLGIWQRF